VVFGSGAVMDRLFNTMVDRTRSRLDVPKVRTLFGSKGRRHRPGGELSPRQAVVIEKPRWNLTIFKVHFGLLTLKAYTKGERVLRFEAIAHHTKQLGCGRTLDKFTHITTRLTAMVDRFTITLDCVDVGFLPDGLLDQLPAPFQLAATRIGGIDLNQPRIRAQHANAAQPSRHHDQGKRRIDNDLSIPSRNPLEAVSGQPFPTRPCGVVHTLGLGPAA
jgi:hypothetical protein